MQKTIERKLQRTKFNTEEELNKFINNIRTLISEYEQDLYSKEIYTSQHQTLVKSWRSKLFKLYQKRDTLITQNDIPEVLESTVNILNRQIMKMDDNTSLLNKGTIKLIGLDYTNADIDKELLKTKEKLVQTKNAEEKELKMMHLAFYVFCGTCIFILADKFIFKI